MRGRAQEHIKTYMCMHLFGLPFVFEYSLKVVDMSCFLTLGLQHCQLVLKSPSTNKRKEHCANSTTVTHPQLFEKLRGNEENIKFWISVCGTISADSLPKNKIRLNKSGYFMDTFCIVNLNATIQVRDDVKIWLKNFDCILCWELTFTTFMVTEYTEETSPLPKSNNCVT